jgi:site-specific DNA-cytosine methylase
MCRYSTTDKYSVAVMASGGLLDTIAAIRAGLTPIWGSDTDTLSQKLWRDLTGSECHGNAFKINYQTLRRPKILKTGFPCPDYTGLGSQLGADGATGSLYLKQVELILKISPDAAIIEQTDNVVNINNGREVKQLISDLQSDYIVHHATIPVWVYGDPTNRKRFIIVALHKRLGASAHNYQFPTPTFNDKHYPTAADVAVPDAEVPAEYILEGEPTEVYHWKEPNPGHIHHVGNYGEGVGHCYSPHPLQSWWGLANTQLTSNGGARRVMLDWRPGKQVNQTRLTTPIETVRMASLSSTYMDWIRTYTSDDNTLRLLVNNGVPLRTSMAIDLSVVSSLKQAGSKPDVPANFHPDLTTQQRAQFQYADAVDPTRPSYCGRNSQCGCYNGPLVRDSTLEAYNTAHYNHQNSSPGIRSMMVDTGASGSLSFTDIEHYLQQSVPSQYSIAVAKGGATMRGSRDGYLPIFVLNTAKQPGFKDQTALDLNTTTVKDLRTELFSLDQPYRHGKFNVLLRQPDFESGVNELYRPATSDTPEVRIPLRYDYTGTGGWWIDYILHSQPSAAHQTLLQRHHEDMLQSNTEANAARLHHFTYSTDTARDLYEQIRCHSAVKSTVVAIDSDVTRVIAQIMAQTATITARHPDERNIKCVKAGLKHGREKLPIKLFHRRYGHIGNCDDTCDICKMIKGCMRHIYKTVDPYRDTRPAHTWSMDTITFSHRSQAGSKYATVLRCKATGVIKVLPLYLKSDIVTQFEQWVDQEDAS